MLFLHIVIRKLEKAQAPLIKYSKILNFSSISGLRLMWL